ncbi:DUF4334 domain-containing protein [Marmoricola sp. RAF53]|uniref:DUF4334 domain-containing protein n=1 Tax=Marmoricola sp. RAF53 TaxID=3233059 RepID=UPI003F97FE0D
MSRARFDTLVAAPSPSPAELDALWADLATVRVEEMLGSWRGGALLKGEGATGHPANGLLTKIGWHGKRFDSALEGHPLICRDADGNLYSNAAAAGGGHASLWEVGFRGETTATMVYDAMPVFDHFKKVDDDTVMGIMNGKLEAVFGTADHYYFWLEREHA